jgi:hypothetical protein
VDLISEKRTKIRGITPEVVENKGRLSATVGASYDVYENKALTGCICVDPTMSMKTNGVSAKTGCKLLRNDA